MDCDSERIWKIVENNRQDIVPLRGKYFKSQASLFDKLHDLYVEQASDKKEKGQRFRSAVNLLKNLDSSFVKPALVLNLYKDEDGYSIVFPHSSIDESTEIYFPYEENYIFDYLNNQQIPPVVHEILQSSEHYQSCEGSIVCEVKNYRNSSDNACDNHLLLLKPTSETISATANDLSNFRNFTGEERHYFESQLLLSTQSPICLDPSTDVVCVTNRLNYNQKKYNSQSVKRYLIQRSHSARFKTSEEPSKWLKLQEFFCRKTLKRSRCFRRLSESWKYRMKPSCPTFMPKVLEEVKKYANQVPSLSYVPSHKVDNPSFPETQVAVVQETSSTNSLPNSVSSIVSPATAWSPGHQNSTSTISIPGSIPHHQTVSPPSISPGEQLTPRKIQNHQVVTTSMIPRESRISHVESPSVQPATCTLDNSSKFPPPLSIWHTTKSSLKGNLPKLHPLMCDPPKVQHSYLKSGQNSTGQNCLQGTSMPQLHKITSATKI